MPSCSLQVFVILPANGEMLALCSKLREDKFVQTDGPDGGLLEVFDLL